MTMHGALHPKSDFDRVYLSREMEGRQLRDTVWGMYKDGSKQPGMVHQEFNWATDWGCKSCRNNTL